MIARGISFWRLRCIAADDGFAFSNSFAILLSIRTTFMTENDLEDTWRGLNEAAALRVHVPAFIRPNVLC